VESIEEIEDKKEDTKGFKGDADTMDMLNKIFGK
jgi:hypothetical protein